MNVLWDRKERKQRSIVAVMATTAAVLLVGTIAYPASAAQPESKAPEVSLSGHSLETTRFQVPFDHTQTLVDAARTTEALGYPVVGYRFENNEIVGQFSPATGVSVEDYVKRFYESYGTQPQTTAVIIEIPVDKAKALYERTLKQRGHLSIEAAGTEFIASAVDGAKIDALLAEHRTKKRERPESVSARAATTWKPTQAEISAYRDSIFVDFSQYYYWDGSTAKTSVMNSDDGFEAEVNIYTANPDFQAGSRGLLACIGDYKIQPFAQNFGWNWSALVNTGTGMTTLASAAGAYADYNDLFDACNRNSMAIGIRNPQSIPSYSDGSQEVLLYIQAPRGVDTTGRIGGVVQGVNETGCFIQPWLSSTDCMGLTASSAGSRTTLGEWRTWIAPNKCWLSFDYGNADPDPYYCG